MLGPREVLLGLWKGDHYFFPGVCWMLFVSDDNSYIPFGPHRQVLLGWLQITKLPLSILEFGYARFFLMTPCLSQSAPL